MNNWLKQYPTKRKHFKSMTDRIQLGLCSLSKTKRRHPTSEIAEISSVTQYRFLFPQCRQFVPQKRKKVYGWMDGWWKEGREEGWLTLQYSQWFVSPLHIVVDWHWENRRKGPTDSHSTLWSLDGALTTSLRVHLPPNGIGVGSIIIHVGLRFN